MLRSINNTCDMKAVKIYHLSLFLLLHTLSYLRKIYIQMASFLNMTSIKDKQNMLKKFNETFLKTFLGDFP